MKKKTINRVHSVRASAQIMELSKAGSSLDLEVYANKEKIGTIIIGRGSFEWIGASKKKGIKYSWTKFAELMDYLRDERPRITKK
ncbi:MAG: hypothetical protein AB2L22_08075 [Syntrophales bacterium]